MSVPTFVLDRCKLTADAKVAKQRLYKAYCSWASDNSGEELIPETFSKDLYDSFPNVVEGRFKVNGKRERFYRGIELKS